MVKTIVRTLHVETALTAVTTDQLSHNQRVRLEALNQAVQSTSLRDPGTTMVLDRARLFEDYIRGTETPGGK